MSSTSSSRPDKKVSASHSVGDLAFYLVNGTKRDSLKDEDLQSLVRLCGKSMVYLPSEYAPRPLILPTCLRATAQYLVRNGKAQLSDQGDHLRCSRWRANKGTGVDTGGVFRIPGSVRVVNALYDYYCTDGDADEITSTTRCPNLPAHIKARTHDVASTFKRLLSGIPGGILGSRSLFDALVSIHSHLEGADNTELRAKLIALAIGSIGCQLRRELVCAVFGLLSLIGHNAEIAPREDEHGNPLPATDLMGYNALGIVFGPLLIGGDINSCTMGGADFQGDSSQPSSPPPNKWKLRWKGKTADDVSPGGPSFGNVHVANSVAEMVTTHWREIVKQMRDLEALEQRPRAASSFWPSVSDSILIKRAADADVIRPASWPPDCLRPQTPPSLILEAGESAQGWCSWVKLTRVAEGKTSRDIQQHSRSYPVAPGRRPRRARPFTLAGSNASVKLLSSTEKDSEESDGEEDAATVRKRRRCRPQPHMLGNSSSLSDSTTSDSPYARGPQCQRIEPEEGVEWGLETNSSTTWSHNVRIALGAISDAREEGGRFVTESETTPQTTTGPMVNRGHASASTLREAGKEAFGSDVSAAMHRRSSRSSTQCSSCQSKLSADSESRARSHVLSGNNKWASLGLERTQTLSVEQGKAGSASATPSDSRNTSAGTMAGHPSTNGSQAGLSVEPTADLDKACFDRGFAEESSGLRLGNWRSHIGRSLTQEISCDPMSQNIFEEASFSWSSALGYRPPSSNEGGTFRTTPSDGPVTESARQAQPSLSQPWPLKPTGTNVREIAAMFEGASRHSILAPAVAQRRSIQARFKPSGSLSQDTVNTLPTGPAPKSPPSSRPGSSSSGQHTRLGITRSRSSLRSGDSAWKGLTKNAGSSAPEAEMPAGRASTERPSTGHSSAAPS